jgi:hypothetical protein
MACYEQALAIHRDVSDRYMEGATLHSMGRALHALGRQERARACWQEALLILRALGCQRPRRSRRGWTPWVTNPSPRRIDADARRPLVKSSHDVVGAVSGVRGRVPGEHRGTGCWRGITIHQVT